MVSWPGEKERFVERKHFRIYAALAAGFGLLVFSANADANWRDFRWGNVVQGVVNSTGGEALELPEVEAENYAHVPGVAGGQARLRIPSLMIDNIPFTVVYYFDASDHLETVALLTKGDYLERLRLTLASQFGPPILGIPPMLWNTERGDTVTLAGRGNLAVITYQQRSGAF
jgi:hypothetical protein